MLIYDHQIDTLEFFVDHEKGGILPTRAHDTDAGADLYCSETVVIPAGEFMDVPTAVHCKLPNMSWGLLTGRSSTLRTKGLLVYQGVIDQGYIGELFAGVQNLKPFDVVVERGSRLAQLIAVPLMGPLKPVEVDRAALGSTTRGQAGFGSSGV